MKPFDDSLRVCPNCHARVALAREDQRPCPECGCQVWFYHFRPILDPPALPAADKSTLFGNPVTGTIIIAIAVLALVALLGFLSRAVVTTCSALIAIGFGVFGLLQQRHAAEIESSLRYLNRMQEYAELMRGRAIEVIHRYNALLGNGDARIRHYYDTIGRNAEADRTEAIRLRHEAALERAAVANVERRIDSMAERLVRDHLGWSARKLRADPDSYHRCLLDLTKAFDFVESVGYQLPVEIPRRAREELKQQFQQKVREQQEKEQQQAIRRQMREEDRLRREREDALRDAEAREREIQARLAEALRSENDRYGAEIEQLQRELADAHARAERAKSMAQLTRAGNVYILSNVGSFGENVFKVGMTRRLEPLDRVRELGDASVPFPFDVHAMIRCDDAPSLENALHTELTRHRVNRVNLRKEFFRVPLEIILKAVEKHHGVVEYMASPDALEYRESQQVTPEQVEEVEKELAEAGIDLDEPDE